MEITSRMMRQSVASIGTHKLICCFSYFCHLLECDRKAIRYVLNVNLLNSKFFMVCIVLDLMHSVWRSAACQGA